MEATAMSMAHTGSVDDIEDMVAPDLRAGVALPPVVPSRALRRRRDAGASGADAASADAAPGVQQRHAECDILPNVPDAGLGGMSVLPGNQRVWVKTFGCSHNVSDSEYMMGLLNAYGYYIVEDAERDAADVWLVNSCTVKDPSQAAFVNLVQQGRARGKSVVVAGCVPQADRKVKGLEGVSVVGVQQIDRVVEVVEEAARGNTVKLLGQKTLPRLDLPKIRKNALVEIIPLSTGCLGSCTYCKTKHARGELGSYDPRAIVERVQQVTSEGVREVWLSSEDTGAYGRDIGTDLPALLRSVLNVMPSHMMLRVGMTNPPFILDHLEAVAQALRHPQVFSFLHVPVQSGSDDVLLRMRREYTVAEFRRVADFLLARVPGLTLATDIICGFPGETEAQFEETLQLVHDYKFPIVNISQFYPRPGTPAARMQRVPTAVVKDRSRRMTALFYDYCPYVGMRGRRCKVWVGSEVDAAAAHIVAHDKAYVKVLLPINAAAPGDCLWVEIVDDSAKFHVVARPLDTAECAAAEQVLDPTTMSARLPKAVEGSGGARPDQQSSAARVLLVLALLAALGALCMAGMWR